jgi:hypothetical protein
VEIEGKNKRSQWEVSWGAGSGSRDSVVRESCWGEAGVWVRGTTGCWLDDRIHGDAGHLDPPPFSLLRPGHVRLHKLVSYLQILKLGEPRKLCLTLVVCTGEVNY